jgi:hypothetical protein
MYPLTHIRHISFIYYSSRIKYSYIIRALIFKLRYNMNPLGF